MNLQGKTAVVTGAARGIGHAYCRRLAADGANVVVVDILDATSSLDHLAGPGDTLALQCDVSDPEQVAEVEKVVTDRFRRCDILVNNAAVFQRTRLADLTLEDWKRIQSINVDSAFVFAKAFVPGMRAAGWGRIVNTGSTITLSQVSDQLAYMTSKGAVHTLTRALANELGDDGVTVNAIAPSVVPTEGFHARPPGPSGLSNEEDMDRISAMQTIKRWSTTDDLANVLAFLVSDDSSFMTGQILHVDGGRVRSGA
ncbi:SDR family NAD(P)-dependent oxidoreductase [Kribbella sp. NPDC023972]|uniref:SDR family NAD(P)-dependent oxidoreductase n=1 Tax=Kribbella sp. NPDC023972 TaxID=3154795 RepID=UPI0033E54742